MAPGGVPYIPDLDAFRAQMQTSGPRLLAIDFTATWCGPCQMIGPHFEAMRPAFPFVDFCKVDVDDNQETAAQCGIRSMPTFKFYRMGSRVAEFTGADVNRLRAVLTEHGGPPTGLAPNTEVVLFALKSKPELNDRKGVVKSFDSSKGRYAVEIDSETLALKRDNSVRRMQECRVERGGRWHRAARGLPDFGHDCWLFARCAYLSYRTRWRDV